MSSAAGEAGTVAAWLTLGYMVLDKHGERIARFVVRMRQNTGRQRLSDTEQGAAGQELRSIFSNAGANMDTGVVTGAELNAMTAAAQLVPLPDEEDGDVGLGDFALLD